jgi:hypothetical protein
MAKFAQVKPIHFDAMKKITLMTFAIALSICSRAQKTDRVKLDYELKEAIVLWEKSVSAIDKKNEDAKINKNVAAAAYLNLTEAHIWLKDFDKAFNYLTEYKMLDEDYSRAYTRTSDFLKDFSTRYDKYVQYLTNY